MSGFDSLRECKKKLPLPELWAKLDLPGVPTKSMCSPFRDDKRESFSVFQDKGLWFWRDHAADESGDEIDLIKRSKGVDTKQAIRLYHELAGIAWGKSEVSSQKSVGGRPKAEVKKEPRKLGQLVACYDYLDEMGKLAHQTLRYDPKDFRQRRPAAPGEPAKDGWVWSLEGSKTYLWNLPAVLKAEASLPIFLVEGEKDCKNLEEIGLVATTVPMGAGKWKEHYTTWLKGKWVVVIGDNDEAGQKHVARVCGELEGVARKLSVIELGKVWEECPEKGDVSDWLASQFDGVETLRGTLTAWAVAAVDRNQFAGCFVVGPKGGVKVLQDAVAEVLVRDRRITFAGEIWWQWTGTVWRPLQVQREVRRWVAEGIKFHPGAHELVSSYLVSSIEELMMNKAAMDPNRFNSHNPEMLSCANGELNIMDYRLAAHRPESLSTVQIPWRFNAEAKCPQWLAWLEEMLPDAEVREHLQEIFGYCLYPGKNFHRFFFFYGDGGTGKSTCVEILTKLVGEDNSVSVRLQDLDNPFTRAQLVGKQLYLAKELNKDSLKHIDLIKAITSGDPINVEKKHKDGYTYRPQGRFMMESNVRAHTSDTSDGFFRRLDQITFKNKIPKDRMDFELGDKLSKEMEGIFWWSLQGLHRLLERGRFTETSDSKSAAEQLEMHRSSVKSFFTSCVEVTDHPDDSETAKRLYDEYVAWCDWEHVRAYYEDADAFSRELLNRFPEMRERRMRQTLGGERVRSYRGLRLRAWQGKEEIVLPE